jgi:sulfatase modifying factor 1
MRVWTVVASVLAVAPRFAADAQGISIETVRVGDAGNVADTTGYGAVNYQYSIGKYEVTNAQYAGFLNAKAASDTLGLYSTEMAHPDLGGITRSGSSGSYSYSTISGRENWPVNFVSFWDAARFTNWLQNGQGSGDTETGTYTLTAPSMANNTVTRNSGSTWAIASEDEWFKAAYYKGGGINAGYWLFPTQSDSITTLMANYGASVGSVTPVGSYAFSSFYGAFDMGGNLFEWNEAVIFDYLRGKRGGWWGIGGDELRSDFRDYGNVPDDNGGVGIGFRVVAIPAPSAIAALAIAGLGVRARRRT